MTLYTYRHIHTFIFHTQKYDTSTGVTPLIHTCDTLCPLHITFLIHACASTLQHTATHGNTLQHTVTHCNNTLYSHYVSHVSFTRVTRPCSTLQRTATHCNTLTRHYNTLQHTATHGNTLQHTVTHCNTLQHTLLPLRVTRLIYACDTTHSHAGTYKETRGSALCSSCPAGKYLSEIGAQNSTSCLPCASGAMSQPAAPM